MQPKCNECGEQLIVGMNWWPSFAKKKDYICITCKKKYLTDWRRNHGINEFKAGYGKYGVPSYLPDGRMNPEYTKLWNADHKGKPKSERKLKYGVPYKLSDGNINPEYTSRKNRARGIAPRSNKYGVPSHLSDGRINPEYSEALRRAKGIEPFPVNWGNTYLGVKYRLPDGKINPNYRFQVIDARKKLVRVHYSGTDPPQCADIYGIHKNEGTPFTILEALHIHHPLSNGKAERKKHGSGDAFDMWLITNNFPDGYQVLCANCNWLFEILRRREHLTDSAKSQRANHLKIKKIVVERYSHGTMACADPYHIHKIPFTNLDLLTGDHINDDGAEHRKRDKTAQIIMAWLYRQYRETGRWPEGYQILCWACQDMKRHFDRRRKALAQATQ